jgi:hypothetical protein
MEINIEEYDGRLALDSEEIFEEVEDPTVSHEE